MGLYDTVAKSIIGSLGHLVEHLECVADASLPIGARELGNEDGYDVEVGVEGSPENEGVDLEEGGESVGTVFEEKETPPLRRAP